MMRTWKIILTALEGLRRTRLRVALTSLGVAIAAGALVSMVAFALGIQRQAETPFKSLGLMNVIRVSPQREDDDGPDDGPADAGEDPSGDAAHGSSGDETDSADAPVLDDAALERMEALPGVVVAFPDFRAVGVKITVGEKTETIRAMGLPREAALLGVTDQVITAGRFFDPGDAPEVILGRRLAGELGFESPEDAVGKTARLSASGLSADEEAEETFTFQRKEFEATIVGVYDVPGMMPGPMSRGALLPVSLMREIPGVRFTATMDRLRSGQGPAIQGYSRATVRVEDHRDLARTEKAIQEMGFHTETLLSRLEEMRVFFVFMDVLLAAVGTVALVVAGLGIVNTLLMSVLERYQEIGTYKAIGASDGDLFVLFLAEAGIIGLLGGIGGLLLGRVVSWILEIAVNVYAAGQGVETHLDVFAFPLWLLGATVLFSVTVSVLSGVYPALRAARIDPIQALRRE